MAGKKIVEFDLQNHLIRLQNRDHGLPGGEKPCVEGPGAQILVQRDPGAAQIVLQHSTVFNQDHRFAAEELSQADAP